MRLAAIRWQDRTWMSSRWAPPPSIPPLAPPLTSGIDQWIPGWLRRRVRRRRRFLHGAAGPPFGTPAALIRQPAAVTGAAGEAHRWRGLALWPHRHGVLARSDRSRDPHRGGRRRTAGNHWWIRRPIPPLWTSRSAFEQVVAEAAGTSLEGVKGGRRQATAGRGLPGGCARLL